MSTDQELRALRLSAWGQLYFGVLGLSFALYTKSEAILLDGYFSLIGFAMSLLTIKVARLVQQPGDETFHFGYFGFEPMLNLLKGIVILGVCGFSLASAIQALLHGGRALAVGPALLYGVVAAVGCLVMAGVMSALAKRSGSPLVAVEVQTWRVDAVVSLGVVAAFLAAFLLEGSRWSHVVDYVDPGLVTLMILAVIPTPIRIVLNSLGELLSIAPEKPVQQEVQERFDELVADYPFEKNILRMARVGRVSYLLAHILVKPDFRLQNVGDLDLIRKRIESGIRELHPSWEVDTLFLADESLI
jgi:cation diffusion facilitator family transporter